MKWHKNDSQMYNLMYFFIANGLDPGSAGRWTLTGEVRSYQNGGYMVMLDDAPKQYKRKELEDMRRVQRKAQEGKLLTGRKMVFSMLAGRVIQQ